MTLRGCTKQFMWLKIVFFSLQGVISVQENQRCLRSLAALGRSLGLLCSINDKSEIKSSLTYCFCLNSYHGSVVWFVPGLSQTIDCSSPLSRRQRTVPRSKISFFVSTLSSEASKDYRSDLRFAVLKALPKPPSLASKYAPPPFSTFEASLNKI